MLAAELTSCACTLGLIKFSETNQGTSKVRKKIATGEYERLAGQGAIFKAFCFSDYEAFCRSENDQNARF